MGAELPRDLDAPLLGLEVVDRADVVQPTAGDEIARRGVSAGHDPRGTERDGVDFVGGVGVPDDELAVLRGRDEVPLVLGPVHRVDLGQVAFERASGLHHDSR